MHLKQQQRSLRIFIRNSRLKLAGLLLVGLLLILLGFSAWFSSPDTKGYRVKISGGIEGLNRHKVAEYLKRHGNDWNLEIEIIPSEGTAEAVTLVQAGELDLALVNGLVRFPEARSVRQVATLTFEAMHMLVKLEYSQRVSEDYAQLAGLSVELGPEASETSFLTESVLRFLRLHVEGPDPGSSVKAVRSRLEHLTGILDALDQTEAESRGALRAKLPDVIFLSSTLPSTLVDRLVALGDYNLVPIRFAEAFSQIPVDEEDLDKDHVDQIHVQPAEIPAYTYGGSRPTPRENCSTFGSPLLVIAHEEVPDEVVTRVLEAVYSGALARLYHPPKLNQIAPTYPLHRAAIAYRDKDKPLVRSDVADLIRQIFTSLGPMIGGCLALYGYYRWRQLLRFLEYFRELQQLDLAAKGLVDLEGIPEDRIGRVEYLESALVQLQRKVVEDFCRNYFYGEGVLENFLSLMSETRDFLRRSQVVAIPDLPRESADSFVGVDDEEAAEK